MSERKNTNQTVYPIRLFVYGTLKRGGWNHDRFCRNAVDIQPATLWGRLWQLPAGYPAIEVPESLVLAHGTTDPIIDAKTQERFHCKEQFFERPEGDWNLVNGEVMTFLDPERDLPPIDRLEGFRPNAKSLYRRVLVISSAGLDWVYLAATKTMIAYAFRLNKGVWQAVRTQMPLLSD